MAWSRARVETRKEQFDDAHADGMRAIRRHDLAGVADAIRRENALIAEQAAVVRDARRAAGLPASAASSSLPSHGPLPRPTARDSQRDLHAKGTTLCRRAASLQRTFTRPVMQERAAILRAFLETRLRWLEALQASVEPPSEVGLFRDYGQRVDELEAVLQLHGPDADLRDVAQLVRLRTEV